MPEITKTEMMNNCPAAAVENNDPKIYTDNGKSSKNQCLTKDGINCNNYVVHDKNHSSNNHNVNVTMTTTATPASPLTLKQVKTNQSKMSNWLESIQIEKLEELLKTDDYCKKGKLDRMDEDGMTLLHRSILANRIEIVQLLIHNGANTSLASRDGWSAIHLAAYVGNVDILGFLLKSN